MSGHDPSVVSRILSEADMAARPGQHDRLVAIANEVAALLREIDLTIGRLTGQHARVLADLRAKVSSGWVPELDHEARIAVLALIDGADHE